MKTVKKRIVLMLCLGIASVILFGDTYPAQTQIEFIGFNALVFAFGASIGYGAGIIKWGFNE